MITNLLRVTQLLRDGAGIQTQTMWLQQFPKGSTSRKKLVSEHNRRLGTAAWLNTNRRKYYECKILNEQLQFEIADSNKPRGKEISTVLMFTRMWICLHSNGVSLGGGSEDWGCPDSQLAEEQLLQLGPALGHAQFITVDPEAEVLIVHHSLWVPSPTQHFLANNMIKEMQWWGQPL